MNKNLEEILVKERIQKLIFKASEIAYKETNSYVDESGSWKEKWQDIYDKNLVKLVVEECAKQLCDIKFKETTNENKVIVGQSLILNHFGV